MVLISCSVEGNKGARNANSWANSVERSWGISGSLIPHKTTMPISGLLLTLNDNTVARSETLAALRARSEFELGDCFGSWLPVAMDAPDDEDSRQLHDWIASLPAVEFVDVVSVHFDDDKSPVTEISEVQL
ncbi:MAG: hypothetical protein H0X66_19185 [Verrucomicrobia bacterium]|nr:hypothetical protein [Verrucomicrobiota bacterium]